MACFSDLICSSIRSLTRRASVSFAWRTARCSEVSFAGGSSTWESGSVGSSEDVELTIERNCEWLLSRSTEWTVWGRKGVGRETSREGGNPRRICGVLCSGDGLREINHRSLASAYCAGDLNRRAVGQLARKGTQSGNGKRASLSRVPFIPSNGELAEVYWVEAPSLICAAVIAHITPCGYRLSVGRFVKILQYTVLRREPM